MGPTPLPPVLKAAAPLFASIHDRCNMTLPREKKEKKKTHKSFANEAELGAFLFKHRYSPTLDKIFCHLQSNLCTTAFLFKYLFFGQTVLCNVSSCSDQTPGACFPKFSLPFRVSQFPICAFRRRVCNFFYEHGSAPNL